MKTLSFDIDHVLFPIGVACAAFLALLVVRTILFRIMEKGAKRTATDFDDSAIAMIHGPSVYWCLAIAIHVGVRFSGLESSHAKPFYQATYVILILSASLAAANLAVLVLRNLMMHARRSVPISGLTIGVLKGLVLTLGGLIILSVLGISITPILGALGVGGLAVALALKDTLENLFAGMYLIWDRSIRVGDYVKLDGGTEGEVEDVGWRTVKVRTSTNSTVIVPNSKVAQSALTNYGLPEKRVVTSLIFYLATDADPEAAEAIMLDEARRANEDIVGVLAVPEPSVRFGGQSTEGALIVTLYFQVDQFQNQGFAQHEIRRRVYRRFRQEGVELFTKTN